MAAYVHTENIVTPEGRGSFIHLTSPKEYKDDNGETRLSYDMKLLFPKSSQNWMEDLPWMWGVIYQARELAFPGGQGAPPVYMNYGDGGLWPVVDGDKPNQKGNFVEEHKGHWVITMSGGNFNPANNLVKMNPDNSATPVSAEECFSGCYFKVQLNAYYNAKRGRICLSMENVAMTRQGEKFGGGGGQNAYDAFGVAPAQGSAQEAFTPPQAGAAAPLPTGGASAPPPTAGPPPSTSTQTPPPVGGSAQPDFLK